LFVPRRHGRDHFIFEQPKHPPDKIIEIIHPTTFTSTHEGTTGKETTLWVAVFTRRHPSSSICWAEAVDESVLGSFPSCKKITYSWINMGDDTTLADYDIAE